tara:strand:- start:315 stop:479 length:165 start_codon:yes stop_codon:yes gene_type:complete
MLALIQHRIYQLVLRCKSLQVRRLMDQIAFIITSVHFLEANFWSNIAEALTAQA